MASNSRFDSLPDKFLKTVRSTFGAAGETLLRDLPRIVAESESRWGLELSEHFPNLSYNYVAPGKRRDGTEIVLKVGVAGNRELSTEMEALRHFDGRGMVRLIDAMPDEGAFLLERVRPGVPLTHETDDAVATRIAAQVMGRLQSALPEGHAFPSVAGWFEGFDRLRKRSGGGCGPLPPKLFSLAEGLSARLLASSPAEVLLHGDLHQDNILSSERLEWVAIDPKGVIGEPCYEVAAFLRNPSSLFEDSSEALSTSARRLRIFSEVLGFDRGRMTGWAVAQAMLSGCWCLEDEAGNWESDMRCAETFARLI
jgi:streptomycin 6-kinase